MKKLTFLLILLAALFLAACNSESTEEKDEASAESTPEKITYESETGPIEVPADPQRVIVL